ncbi:MAG: hypothetical protein U9O95_06310 [Candidatus Marinimicrobia bacterium]|nr:hypothetical protein [Candidatus Neomarinimicrobiota bacterium]
MNCKYKSLIVIILTGILLLGCFEPEPVNVSELIEENIEKITISQGIAGSVIYKEGNFMPPVSENSGIQYPLSRKVFLYDYTEIVHFPYGHFIERDSVHSTLIAQTISDRNGFYQFSISEVGIYSIFVLEDGKFYMDYADGGYGINPVTIYQDSVLIYNIYLDYNASY